MAFSRFIIAGTATMALTLILYWLFLFLFIPYPLAYSIAFFAGIALTYVLNERWVFKRSFSYYKAAFPLLHGMNYLASMGLVWILVEYLGIPKVIVPLLAAMILCPAMFFLSKAMFRGKTLGRIVNTP